LIVFFYYIDYNYNGLLDYDEVLGGFLSLGNASIEKKIKIAFGLYDRDNNGYLDFHELVIFLRSFIRISQGKRPKGLTTKQLNEFEVEIDLLTKSLAESVFKEIDLDGNN